MCVFQACFCTDDSLWWPVLLLAITVRHEPWRKATVKVAPSSQLLEAFGQLKIIRFGVASPTPNSQPGGPGYHFSSGSPPLTCPDPSSSYATPAIPLRIILFFFFNTFGVMPNRFTSKVVRLLSTWIWLCISCKYSEFCFHRLLWCVLKWDAVYNGRNLLIFRRQLL